MAVTQTPADLSATEALDALRSGSLSPEDLAQACLRRVAAREAVVHAWSFVDAELVLRQARALERSRSGLPLFGVPIGVKDVILTQDMPTQYNSPAYRGFHSRADAACIKILRAAGAVIFGKTDTVEFAATGRKALTTNPHDPGRTPGGSSSGSAAAVADHHVPLALGTQTGGSVLRPASYCGTWAVKPTWNLVSNEGAKAFSATLDTLGWFARTADDLGLLYSVFDPEWTPVTPLRLAGARVAICQTPAWDQADDSTRAALGEARERLRAAGADVETLVLPSAFDGLAAAQLVVMRAEARSVFLAERAAHGEALDAELRQYADNVWGYGRDDLLHAYDLAASCRVAFDDLARGYDAILTPSSAGEAPVGLTQTGPLTFNGLWTLLHVPCVNVPGFTGQGGMPVGLTVTGPRFADRAVLAAASAFGPVFAPRGAPKA